MSLDILPAALRDAALRDGIDFEVVSSIEAAHTAEAAARILGVAVADIVKTLVLTDGARTVAAIVPGDRRVDRSRVAAAAGCARVRFATGDEVLARTGYPPGGVAPLGFATPVTVIVDASLTEPPGRCVIAGGGRPELLVRLRVADIVRHAGATIAAIAS